MAISKIPPHPPQTPPAGAVLQPPPKVREAFGLLEKSLKSGDVESAKTAVAQIVKESDQLLSSDPKGKLATFLKDMSAALESGDVTGAQKLLATHKPKGPPPHPGVADKHGGPEKAHHKTKEIIFPVSSPVDIEA
jgi:ribosomal protein S20